MTAFDVFLICVVMAMTVIVPMDVEHGLPMLILLVVTIIYCLALLLRPESK